MKVSLSNDAKRLIGDIHSLAKCFESGAKFSGFTMPITIIDTFSTPSRSFNPFRYGGTYFIVIDNNVSLLYRKKGLFTLGSYVDVVGGIELTKPELHYVALEIDNLFKAIKKNEYYSKELGDIYVIKDNCM